MIASFLFTVVVGLIGAAYGLGGAFFLFRDGYTIEADAKRMVIGLLFFFWALYIIGG